MSLRACAAAALLSLLPAGSAAADALERLTLRHQQLGWEAVGRLDLGTGGFCTGVLVAPDLVLTAAHCLHDPESGTPHKPGRLRFRAGLADGTSVAERRGRRLALHPGFDPSVPTTPENLRVDAGLVELESPMPIDAAAPFAVGELGAGARSVSVVSFARGREEALSWQRSCGVLGRWEGLLAFDCDVDKGASGAPVFARSGGRARIVSLVSAGGRYNGRQVSFGMEIAPVMAALKAALRAAPFPAPTTPDGGPSRLGQGDARGPGGARFISPDSP